MWTIDIFSQTISCVLLLCTSGLSLKAFAGSLGCAESSMKGTETEILSGRAWLPVGQWTQTRLDRWNRFLQACGYEVRIHGGHWRIRERFSILKKTCDEFLPQILCVLVLQYSRWSIYSELDARLNVRRENCVVGLWWDQLRRGKKLRSFLVGYYCRLVVMLLKIKANS